MNSPEAELEELRNRVARLEAQVAALQAGRTRAQALPATPAARGTEPPLLAAAAVRPRAPGVMDKLGEMSSTVWVAVAGAAIFLIGAVYGLTVSIQRGWISPPVRVGAGLVTGLAAGFWAARLLSGGRRGVGLTLLAVGVGTWTFSLYFGAKSAHLFPLGLGFSGAAVATLLAGGLAARLRSDGTLAVALVVGLATPLAFSDGSGTLPGLLAYLLALGAAQLAAYYATDSGHDWNVSRGLGLVGAWLVALLGTVAGRLGDPVVGVALIGGLLGVGLVLAWLPRHPQSAQQPAAASAVVLVAAALATWGVWRRAYWQDEMYALALVVLAALSLALLALARRTGTRKHDQVFVLLAGAFALVAVPVAIEWRWVTLAWGVGALALAWAARAQAERSDGLRLEILAGVAAVAASAVWLGQALWQGRGDWIFLNPVFAGGLAAAAAWGLLLLTRHWPRAIAFSALQAVAVNALAWEFARAIPAVAGEEATLPLGPLVATLTYATVGAGQWLRGVLYEVEATRAKALRLAGYAWLAVAAVKLLGYDLSRHDLLFRALAALGVGAVFIGAALWADRQGKAGASRSDS